MIGWISIALALLFFLLVGTGRPVTKEPGCLSCHQGIESLGKTHQFPCGRCHGGDEKAGLKEKAHQGLIPNPSSLDQALQRCGPCHRDQVRRVRGSLMATSAGEINPTRYLWGAQPREQKPFLNRPLEGYAGIPDPVHSRQLVDDLLRRRCLRCHLNTRGMGRYGDWRAEGCAACHLPSGPDGLSQSGDRAIHSLMNDIRQGKQPQRKGFPLKHQFTRAVPTTQCLTCHNGHRLGMDYVGLAERDYEASYRFNAPDGESPSLIYGLDPRRMPPDIHHEKGLGCIDCHNGREVMGHGPVAHRAGDQAAIRCQDCHGTPDRGPKTKRNPSPVGGNEGTGGESVVDSRGNPLSNVCREAGGIILISRVTGKRHRIPTLNGPAIPVEHRITEHIQKMECHSCHAFWSYQDFGFHLIREDRADYQKWAALWMQNDPQIQELLRQNLPQPTGQWSPPRARDFIDGSLRTGIWYAGFSYRRLENPIFGINHRGRTSVFRPLSQFVVSQVNGKGQILMDSRILMTQDGKPGLGFNPYAPHTIRRPTRPCEACHLNPRAVGLGNRFIGQAPNPRTRWSGPLTFPRKDGIPIDFEWEALVDLDGKPLQTQTRPGARPYNQREIKGLLTKSKAYKGWYTRYYQEKGLY